MGRIVQDGYGVFGAGAALLSMERSMFQDIETSAGATSAVTSTGEATIGLQSVAWSGTSGDGADCIAVDVGSAILADLATRDNMPTIDEAGQGSIGPREDAPLEIIMSLLQGSDPRFMALQQVRRQDCPSTCCFDQVPWLSSAGWLVVEGMYWKCAGGRRRCRDGPLRRCQSQSSLNCINSTGTHGRRGRGCRARAHHGAS